MMAILNVVVVLVSLVTACPCTLIVLCVPAVQDSVHTCPNCNSQVGTHKKMWSAVAENWLWAYRQAGLSIQFHSYSRNFGGENFGKLGNLLWICQSFICQLFVIIEAGLKFAKVFFHQIFPALMVCFSSYQLAIVIFSVYNFHVSDRV